MNLTVFQKNEKFKNSKTFASAPKEKHAKPQKVIRFRKRYCIKFCGTFCCKKEQQQKIFGDFPLLRLMVAVFLNGSVLCGFRVVKGVVAVGADFVGENPFRQVLAVLLQGPKEFEI